MKHPVEEKGNGEMDEIEEIKERWKDFAWCKDTKDIQILLNRVEELEEAVKDALTNGDEINTIDYRSTWKAKLKKVLDLCM